MLVRITTVGSTTAGAVALGTKGRTLPSTIAATVQAKRTSSSLGLVRPDSKGHAWLRAGVKAKFRVSVVGYLAGSATAAAGLGGWTLSTPVRRMDTSRKLGGSALVKGKPRKLSVVGRGGVPAKGVRAIVAVVSAKAGHGGSVSVTGAGTPALPALAGSLTAALVVAPADSAGRITLSTTSSSATVVVDVVGWVSAGATGASTVIGGLTMVSGGYLLGSAGSGATVRATASRFVATGRAGVPKSGVAGLIVSVRADTPSATGTLLGAAGPGKPGTGLPVTAKTTAGGWFVLPVDSSGTAWVRLSKGTAKVRVWVVGWLAAALPVDRVAPVLSLDSPSDGARVNLSQAGAANVAGTVADSGSGVDRVDVLLDGVRVGSATVTGTVSPPTYGYPLPMPVGEHTVMTTAYDRAGNHTSVTATVTAVAPAPDSTVGVTEAIPDPDLNGPASKQVSSDLTGITATSMTVAASDVSAAPGNILLVAPSPAAPDGALVSVTAVQQQGASTVLSTQPATLTDAFQDLELDTVGGLTTAARSQPHAAGTGSVDTSFTIGGKGALEQCFTLQKTVVECSDPAGVVKASAEASLTAKFATGLRIGLKIKTKWHAKVFPEPTIVQFSVAVVGDQQTTLEGKISGALTKEGPDIDLGKYTFGTIVIPTPIPGAVLVLSPSAEATGKFYGSFTVEGKFACTASGHLQLGAAYYDTTGWQNASTYSSDLGCADRSVSGTLEAGFKTEVKVIVKIEGVVGPTVVVTVTPKVAAALENTPDATTELTVKVGATLEATIGVEVSILGKTLSKWDAVLWNQEYWKTLVSAGGDPAALPRADTTGDPVTLAITTPGQTAVQKFSGKTGQRVGVFLSKQTLTPATTSGSVRIVDLDASPVQPVGGVIYLYSGSGTASLSTTLPHDGTYGVQFDLNDDATGVGEIIFSSSIATEASATIGGPATDLVVKRPGGLAEVTFPGLAGQEVTAAMQPSLTGSGGTDMNYLRIVDGTGNVLGHDFHTDLSWSLTARAVLPATGTYHLEWDPAGAAIGASPVHLSSVTVVPATLGGVVTLSPARPGQVVQASFSGAAGQEVTANLLPHVSAAAGDVAGADMNELRVLDATGKSLGADFHLDFGWSLNTRAVLPADGIYRIEFDPASGHTGTGTLGVTMIAPVAADPSGTTVLAVANPGQVAQASFTGIAGQEITANLIPHLTGALGDTKGVEANFLRVRDAAGKVLAQDLHSNTDVSLNTRIVLPLDGTYRLEFDPASAYTGTGTLTAGLTSVVPAAVNGTTTLTVTRPGQIAQATLSGAAGQEISANLMPHLTAAVGDVPGLELNYLRILDVNGKALGTDFHSAADWSLSARAVLPADGTYRIEFDPPSAYTGTGILGVSAVVAAPVAANGTATLAVTTPGQVAQGTFVVAAGQVVTATVVPHLTAPAGDTAGLEANSLRLRDATGKVVASDLDSTISGTLSLKTTALAAGTYRVEFDPAASWTGTGALTLATG